MYRFWYSKLHYPLIYVTLSLTAYGLLVLFSATFKTSGLSEVIRQFVYALTGLFFLSALLIIDYRIYPRWSAHIYVVIIFLLLAVMFVGHQALGAQRWLHLGPLGTFQPSEVAKLGLIIVISSFFAKQENPVYWKTFLLTGLLVGIPALLIMKQPDLGTSLVLAACTFSMLFVAGYNPWLLVGILLTAGAVITHFLSGYQRTRLFIFIDPMRDPQGGGWNIIQSLIAVGSGGLFGKGLLAGTQTQLKFVPEHHTDFIFTVLGEEIGFIGCLILFILYFLLLWFGLKIAFNAKDTLGRLLAVGIVVMFLFHILVNVGMTMGVMPITGIPLPFISFGGSSLLTNYMAIGILLNIHLRQDSLIS